MVEFHKREELIFLLEKEKWESILGRPKKKISDHNIQRVYESAKIQLDHCGNAT